MSQQLSLDDMAADMATKMLAKSGSGDMPTARGGESGAEGGFTPEIGGKVIDEQAQKSRMTKAGKEAMAKMEGMDKAGAYTGSAITAEPGRQGAEPKTSAKVSDEPGREMASAKAGTPGLPQEEDGKTRARKDAYKGQPGEPGLPQEEDEKTRARKGGKVEKSAAAAEEEGEEEAEKGMSKSEEAEIDGDELIKSLEVLEAIAQGSTIKAPAERREELAGKLAEGTLSKSEMHELSDLMKSGIEAEAAPAEELKKSGDEAKGEGKEDTSFQDSFADDSELQKGYEVSSFLERHSQLTAAGLDQIQDRLAKSLETHRDRTGAFNSQLAKSLLGMAKQNKRQEELIKSLQERLNHVENTPMPRKGVTSAKQLQKSIDGEVGGGSDGGQLSRNQIFDTLEKMAMTGVERTPSGYRVDHAMAMFEQTGQLQKSLYNDVLNFRSHMGNGQGAN